jgi:PAS domain S-box-containing protein
MIALARASVAAALLLAGTFSLHRPLPSGVGPARAPSSHAIASPLLAGASIDIHSAHFADSTSSRSISPGSLRRVAVARPLLILGSVFALLVAAIAGLSVQRASSKRGLAETALRDSEEKHRMLLDGIQDYAIYMLDPRGNIVSWNGGAERIKGYSSDQIIGRNFSCFFPRDEVELGRPQEILRITAARGRHEEQGRRVRKDGSQFLATVSLTALRDSGGKLHGFSEISRDLSESQESEARYRGLLEAAPDAMVVVNTAGEIVLLNAEAEHQFGYRRDELLGQPVTNIIPEGFAERLIADGTRSAAEALAQQIGTGIELIGRRKDGSEFPLEIMLSPLESAEGILVTAAIRDISVRRAAEEHLSQMEGRYRGLLEAAPDAMVVVNTAGEIVLLNAEAENQFRYRRDELLGQPVTNIIPEGFAERLIADGTRSAAEALAQQIGTGIELIGRRKDGSEFPLEIMLSPLESAEGILVTAAIRDISVRRAAEEHLAQMEGRYRGLLEAAPDAMVVVNTAGEIVLLNAEAENQFRYRRDELLGQPVTNIIPKGFAERLIADGTRSAAEALAQQIGTGIELIGRRKDGSEFPLEIMLSPLESAEGILVTAAIRDISVRRAAEEHLAQMEGRYRGLLEAAPDAMVVVNTAGEIVLLNAEAENQFGYRRDELLGQRVTNIIPEGFAERLIADGTRSAAEALAQQIGTGIELIGRRKDGSEFPLEIMLSPLESAEGILVTAAIRDISERKQAVEELRRTTAYLENLVDLASAPIIVWDTDQRITRFNFAFERLTQRRAADVLGLTLDLLFPDATRQVSLEQIGRTMQSEGLQSAEIPILRADGDVRTVLWSSANIYDTASGGKLLAVIAQGLDITERKQAEARLLQKVDELYRSNKELEQFAYIASHDLQEPLRMVASYTQLLSRRYKGRLDSDADEFIAFAVDGANRMQRLIQDLLEFSRVGTKGRELLETSSEDALQNALVNLHGAIEASGAQVTHDPLPFVMADESQLVQLFQNLVGNAIKYQLPGAAPRVHVSAAINGGRKWQFAVQDNGLGIDAQYFDKIFGMFQRLHKRDEYAGTGIGLAICKKIVERHGGSISVESKSGEGSTFRFALAAAKEIS